MKINPDASFVKSTYDKTIMLLKSHSSDYNDGLLEFLGEITERYALCPASSRKEYYSAFPGGLAFHNLHMYYWMKKFSENMFSNESFDDNMLLHVSILHEIGKVGSRKSEYYIPKESEWHRERGMYYDINKDIQYMKVGHRSLHLAQNIYGSKGKTMDEEIFLSILLHDPEESKDEGYRYRYTLPSLAVLTQFAYRHSVQLEKQNEVSWPR